MENRPTQNEPGQSDPDKRLPRIGITIGDAAGIGPEITLKAIDEDIKKICVPVVIGDADFLRRAARDLNLPADFRTVKKGEPVFPRRTPGTGRETLVYDLANLSGAEILVGRDAPATGGAAAENIQAAVRLWSENQIDAVATAPISKRAIQMGGYDYPGHTEFLAHLTGTREFAMSFFAEDRLRVVLLSTHVSLADAINLVKKEKLVELILFTDRSLGGLLKRRVKIAVAGLNPHASEGGMFGREEAEEILPAVEKCRAEFGVDVSGPFSPDTVFLRAYRGEFDAVVACYHDQATIPVKCLSFGASVNVTLGLPLVRTSVDHGTAFDIAGRNLADPSSMRAAIKLAARLVSHS